MCADVCTSPRLAQHKEPYYNHLEWEEDSRRAEEYLRNCAEYPIVLPSARGTGGQRQLGGYTREPGLVRSTPAPLQVRIKGGRGQSTLSTADGQLGEDGAQMGADRGQLQSRGSSREARMQQTMPKVEEED